MARRAGAAPSPSKKPQKSLVPRGQLTPPNRSPSNGGPPTNEGGTPYERGIDIFLHTEVYSRYKEVLAWGEPQLSSSTC